MSNEMVERVWRYTDAHPGVSPLRTPVEGLALLRSDHERQPAHMIINPALCVVVQGAKWTTIGNKRFVYEPGQALVVPVEVPALGRITAASPSEPFLGLVIELNRSVMREVMSELEDPPVASGSEKHRVFVADFDGHLAECALRLVRLLDTPKAIPILQPTILREMSYWLLAGPYGSDIANMTLGGQRPEGIIAAIHALRERFDEPVSIDALAKTARMSVSAFHRKFRTLTSMSPLQYQKRLRLLEARRLIASKSISVETAAFKVGYESPSQFSREYSRMFGAPPRRDTVATS